MNALIDSPESETVAARGSLARRFAIAGGVVLVFGGAAIGAWVAGEVESNVTRNTATATALFMESVISPLSQELASRDRLSPGASRALEEIFTNTPIGERVISYKIWKPGGLIVHASDATRIGQRFPANAKLEAAWRGEVVADFEGLEGAESAPERASGLPLLEIYSPIREVWSGRIIAVAEFYEVANDLKRDIAAAQRKGWLVVAGVMLVMAAGLFGIVLRGSRTIDAQQRALTGRVAQLARLAAQNEALRRRIERASSRTAEVAERNLRRLSAELHDGPAQLMSLAALRLERISDAASPEARSREVEVVRSAVTDAMEEIRAICRGLALPDIEALDLKALAQRAVDDHRRRTDVRAVLEVHSDAAYADMPQPVRICVYRFLQEALWNAWRHAPGARVAIRADASQGALRISVSDDGPGFDPEAERPNGGAPAGGMGLIGLRSRIESLGGELEVRSAPGAGAALTMQLSLTRDAKP